MVDVDTCGKLKILTGVMSSNMRKLGWHVSWVWQMRLLKLITI